MSMFRSLMMNQGASYPDWIVEANKTYGIDKDILLNAYTELPDIYYTFAGGKTQWLTASSGAYIDTDIKAYPTSIFTINTYATGDNFFPFGAKDGLYLGRLSSWSYGRIGYNGTNKDLNNFKPSANNQYIFNIDVANKTFKMNSLSTSMTAYSSSANQTGYSLYGVNGWVKPNGCKISTFIHKIGSTTSSFLVPHIRGGENGMLDLMTDTFLTNCATSGTLTYELV